LFAEGPVWDKTNAVLLFSDIRADRIYELELPDKLSVFREPSNKSNGLAFDMEGRLLAAEHGSRSITRTSRDGSIETMADNCIGEALNSPNDIAVRSDGTIYFTDPAFGLENRERGVDFMGLYRLTPNGLLVLEGKYDKSPNGVALSPNEKTLYLALTFDNQVLAFDVALDGSTGNPRTFGFVQHPDGMAVDLAGNTYLAGREGISIFTQNGTELGVIRTDRQPTNCGFGGPDGDILFVTARESLYRIKVPIPGF
jgi:gluconolactonase